MPRQLAPLGLCCTILFASAGGWARGDELRLCVTDADSGKPVEGATVERWASEWQPRILRLPAKFWFPQKAVTVNAEGGVTLKTVAGDDWYAVKADGFERVKVERVGDKYQTVPRGEEKPRALVVKDGVVIIPLTRTPAKEEGRKPK